ncbi:outer membrane protein assembly factor BamD [Acetobacter okinawensis]|uniref:hypothetical protein n=1 Tax=Acetobacter okinawensis TaxID=1076594 RepID=UPI001F5A9541|nr:hypothetical protein [Acetobacter okinawensis]
MRRLRHMLLLATPLVLVGCGASQSKPTALDDAAWDQAMAAGRDSFELGRYTVAVSQYRKAANLALVRDDGSAVAEAGYDLAVSQLAANTPADALQTTQATRQAVQLRGGQEQFSLDLVEAASTTGLAIMGRQSLWQAMPCSRPTQGLRHGRHLFWALLRMRRAIRRGYRVRHPI